MSTGVIKGVFEAENMWYNNSNDIRGFTLIELLVVISIIGLLSTIATVSLGTARQRARDVRRVADIRQLRTALELYLSDENTYPVVPAGSAPLVIGDENARVLCGGLAGFVANLAACTGRLYMANVPTNIAPGGSTYTYLSVSKDAAFQCTQSPCENYAIEFSLEKSVAQLKDGLHCSLATGAEDGPCPHP